MQVSRSAGTKYLMHDVRLCYSVHRGPDPRVVPGSFRHEAEVADRHLRPVALGQIHCLDHCPDPPLSLVGPNVDVSQRSRSFGWQLSSSKSAASVEKRTALARPFFHTAQLSGSASWIGGVRRHPSESVAPDVSSAEASHKRIPCGTRTIKIETARNRAVDVLFAVRSTGSTA